MARRRGSVEQELVDSFAVSRTPVREALLQLEAMGLIRRHPRKGATVFRPTLEEFLAILEVHGKLEGQAAGLAARRLSVTGAKAMEASVAACEGHAATRGDDDPDAYYQLNLRFHATVAEASGNPFLLDMIKTNTRKLLAYNALATPTPGSSRPPPPNTAASPRSSPTGMASPPKP